jgi:hypothetical protein
MTDLQVRCSAPPEDGPSAASSERLYLYAILAEAHVDTPAWRAAERENPGLSAVCGGGLAAAVSPVPRSFERLVRVLDESDPALGPGRAAESAFDPAGRSVAEAVRAHECAVERLLGCGPLLPVRLGSIVNSPDSLARALERDAPNLRQQLTYLGPRREWGLKVWWHGLDGPREGTDAPRAAAEAAAGGPGRTYLAERRRRRDAAAAFHSACEERGQAIESFLSEQVPMVCRVGLLDVRDPDSGEGERGVAVFEGSFLLDPADQTRFFARLDDALTQAGGLSARCSGPWPPYGFVDVALGGAR